MKLLCDMLVDLKASVLGLVFVGCVMAPSLLFSAPLKVGDDFGGGKVVYLVQPGEEDYKADEPHGIVVAPEDLSDDALSWSEAKAAAERMEIGGAKGWSLPNEKELLLLYQNRDVVGGFREFSYYWSGSEVGGQKAVAVDFYNGDKILSTKSGATLGIRRVRPVRRF